MIVAAKTTPYRTGESVSLLDSIMYGGKTNVPFIRTVLDYPFKILRQRHYERHVEGLTNCKGFSDFENRMPCVKARRGDYRSIIDYISALLLVDQIESSLKEVAIELPDNLHALDVGCGDWYYALSLRAFLPNYSE